MVIRILDIVDACDSNDQGEKVRAALLARLKQCDAVHLDFSGVSNVTSSFVNSAFISLLPDFDVGTIKTRVKITKVNRQIRNMIRDRFSSEVRALG